MRFQMQATLNTCAEIELMARSTKTIYSATSTLIANSLLYSSLFLIVLFSLISINSRIRSSPLSPSSSSPHTDKQVPTNEKLERLEIGLARARADILAAGRKRRYVSYENDTFIPRGSIYRNPYAFHQSYREMENKLRIWVYKEGEPPIFHSGPMKDIYSIEGHLLEHLHNRRNPLAAAAPEEATAFYLPIGFTNIIHYLYTPRVHYNRRLLQNVVEDYVSLLAEKYPYWNRTGGADHFFVGCHDWAPDASAANPDLFRNLIRVLCNANASESFRPERDVSLPEINVPDDALGPPDVTSTAARNRSILAFFAGGRHGYVREKLLDYWKGRDPEVQVHEYLPGGVNYFEEMARAKYCLCPSGWEVASPRLVESMHVGCVPVVVSDGYVLPFSDVLDWGRFSVHVPVGRIAEIKKILEGIKEEEYLELQRGVAAAKRHFLLHRPARPYDLLHMVLHSVWLRRINISPLHRKQLIFAREGFKNNLNKFVAQVKIYSFLN
ncbi:probable glycosyltransferase At5g20260 [Andrographis paniculata]|uniref:probable glycosyltransferase At5g20260 n=1 Tax=Andrographis paniculata TaxID=175694 RepID=UPI0021E928F1|nr:probable glycosyltransferase At5g20260 [Andrographis paniculata]